MLTFVMPQFMMFQGWIDLLRLLDWVEKKSCRRHLGKNLFLEDFDNSEILRLEMMIRNNKNRTSQPTSLGSANRMCTEIFRLSGRNWLNYLHHQIGFNLYGPLITRLICPALQNIKLQNPKEISPVKFIGKL